ncbi:transcription elongation regulator 1-like [Zophobas morio]|uniref:transcription elongation regulator 1-like n=1 Tax=Zophobas morio TaxID=2755281 RepID=UPI00308356DA
MEGTLPPSREDFKTIDCYQRIVPGPQKNSSEDIPPCQAFLHTSPSPSTAADSLRPSFPCPSGFSQASPLPYAYPARHPFYPVGMPLAPSAHLPPPQNRPPFLLYPPPNFTPLTNHTSFSAGFPPTLRPNFFNSQHSPSTLPITSGNVPILEKENNTKSMKDSVETSELDPKKLKTEPSDGNNRSGKPDKPIARIAVPDSFWLVVLTASNKRFYYNTVSKTSDWDLPVELELMGFDDKAIDKLIELYKINKEIKKENFREAQEPEKDTVESANLLGKPQIEGIEEDDQEKISKVEPEDKLQPAATLFYDERVKRFRELLEERKVSAFSTWDKEQTVLALDPRYKLLTMKERKQIFDKYCRECAELERAEKREQIIKNRHFFKELLEEVVDLDLLSFSEFSAKYSRDPRFKCVEKWKERELLFKEAAEEFKKNATIKREERKARNKQAFIVLLNEKGKMHVESTWKRVKERITGDRRYDILSREEREKCFDEYLTELRERDTEYMKKQREKASIKERERLVKATQEELQKSLNKEKSNFKRDEGVETFKNLLRDVIRKHDICWNDAKEKLKQDSRWNCGLTREEKEKYFYQHLRLLNEKLASAFWKLIDETKEIALTSEWVNVRPLICDDFRFEKFGDDRKREAEFRYYMRQKVKQAKIDFKQLLRETKLITHKTKNVIAKDPRELSEIEKVLKNDKRYGDLDCIAQERSILLLEYIDDLAQRGSPPPVTATVRDRPLVKLKQAKSRIP